MTRIQPDKIAGWIKEAADQYILPRYKALEEHEINSKTSPRDLVTQADLDVEAFFERILPQEFPGSVLIGEEGASADERVLDALQNDALDIWILDPVDGTHNFVHHKPEFGVMLAYIRKGEAVSSWIYNILDDEMAISELGGGAYIGSQRLQVSDKQDPEELSGHINPRFFPKQYRDHLDEAGQTFSACQSLHCAAHEYLRVARGSAEFSVYSKLKPWDHVAGCLMVAEAGGYVAQWDKAPYLPKNYDVGLIAAANQEFWDAAYKAFLEPIL